LSDEFVDVILGKLVEALRPGLPQALLAVQIIATGFAGLRFLRQSPRHMTGDYINVYNYINVYSG
jgi:hypothetical protein